MVADQEGGARVIMRRRHTNTRLRLGFLAASAAAFALSFVVAAPTVGVAATEPAADETLSINGSGRYADQLAHVVLEYGSDVEYNPYALLVEFESDADPADVDDLLEDGVVRHRELDIDDLASLGLVTARQLFNLLRLVSDHLDDVVPQVGL